MFITIGPYFSKRGRFSRSKGGSPQSHGDTEKSSVKGKTGAHGDGGGHGGIKRSGLTLPDWLASGLGIWRLCRSLPARFSAERLPQKFAETAGAIGLIDVLDSRDQDDRYGGGRASDRPDKRQPVAGRHFNVDDNQVQGLAEFAGQSQAFYAILAC